MITEEVAGLIASVGVGIGWSVKYLLSKIGDKGDEGRRGTNAVLRSMRSEIDRLSDLTDELSQKLEEEVRRRQEAEGQVFRLRSRVEDLERQLRAATGQDSWN